MAEEMEMNGEDFSQDVQTNEESMNGNENGAGDKASNGAAENNGSAEAPGRDDDRYVCVPHRHSDCRHIGEFFWAHLPSHRGSSRSDSRLRGF